MKNKYIKRLSIIGFVIALTSLFVYKNLVPFVFAEGGEVLEQSITEELTHEQIVYLTDQFMDILVQDVDEAYRVDTIKSKEQLYSEFEEVALREAASEYVDFYYKEKPDGLYLTPTELPPWFIKKNNYDRIKVDENTVKIEQNNELDLYGNYTIEIEFTYDTDWKISSITHK